MLRQEVQGGDSGGGIAGGGNGKDPGGDIMPPGGGGKVLPSGNLVIGPPNCALAGNCAACVLEPGKGGYGADAAPE